MSQTITDDELAAKLRSAEIRADQDLEANRHPQAVLESVLDTVREVAALLEGKSS